MIKLQSKAVKSGVPVGMVTLGSVRYSPSLIRWALKNPCRAQELHGAWHEVQSTEVCLGNPQSMLHVIVLSPVKVTGPTGEARQRRAEGLDALPGGRCGWN